MDRTVILSMVAAGRITAWEAERLLRAWNEGRDWSWVVILGALVCATQVHGLQFGSVWHAAQGVIAAGAHMLRESASAMGKGTGGIV